MLQMMFQYSHTDVEEQDSVFTVMWKKNIQYSHTHVTEEDSEEHSVLTYR